MKASTEPGPTVLEMKTRITQLEAALAAIEPCLSTASPEAIEIARGVIHDARRS